MTATLNPALLTGNGHVNQGWRRWVRARDAAYAKPVSSHARLFFARRDLAAFFDASTVSVREYRDSWSGRVKYRTCSDFCAVLQHAIDTAMTADKLQTVWPDKITLLPKTPSGAIPRTFTCFVCRRRVNPATGTVDDSLRIDFYDPKQPLKIEKPKPRAPRVSEKSTPSPAKSDSYSVLGLNRFEYEFLRTVLTAHRTAHRMTASQR